MKNIWKIAVLLIFSLVAGCSWFEEPYEVEKTAEQLVQEGSSAFMDEDYLKAIKAFKDLKNWYPFSKYVTLAELKIADSHYQRKEYEEAIFAYKEFEKLHPRNEAIPHVIYRRGMCWFNRIDTVDRTSNSAKKALDQFRRLAERFPDDEYAAKARENMEKCVKNMAGHELYVGNYYYKAKKYEAAMNRYQYLMEHYPDSEAAQTAEKKIKAVKEAMENQ
ncbi:MAG: outer membrane protein assembly factor BamD [Thermodesulfobacteriota bacterium]